MNADLVRLFAGMPAALPLYTAVEQRILAQFPAVRVSIGKTQVSFANQHGFAFAWPPIRSIKDRPEVYLVLTFGLGYRKQHPRIVEAVQPHPHRWTHHVLITHERDLDAELMEWLRESYEFVLHK